MQENFDIYHEFASVYDLFMDEIPYDEWFSYLCDLLKSGGVSEGLVVDVACGTGEITKRLSEMGYETVGIDLSEEMLMVAREKCSSDILLLHQDMCRLELPFEADAMVCLCDGTNYLTEEEQLVQCFKSVYQHLKPGGIWVFDMKTPYFYQEILGNQTFADNRESASYIWENEYDKETGINTYLLTIYELADEKRDLFIRNEELHHQRAYSQNTIQTFLLEAGFQNITCYEALTEQEPSEKSERIYWIAQKQIGEEK